MKEEMLANYDENSQNFEAKIEEIENQKLKKEYKFKNNNPYNSLSNPLEGIKQVIESGDTLELSKLLEAHLQKNPTDSKGWKALGFITQERDQDQNSVICFLNAIKHNPTDKDVLLQLGVSYLNIFDQIHSMSHIVKYFIFIIFYY